MSFFPLPKIKTCSFCRSYNLIMVNGEAFQNNFLSLKDWKLKKIFNCRKCRIELGLFLHNDCKEEKLIWLELFKCQDSFFDQLNKLQSNKLKNKSQSKKYNDILEEIKNIQNKIRLDQIKIRIKMKIQNKGLLI